MSPDVGAYLVFFLVVALYYALLCLGLNLQWGVTGLFNVGVAGFVAVGAYASALLTAPDSPDHWGGLGWPVAVGWAGAALLAGLAALLVGAVTLRLRHDYLAIATFGIAVTIQLIALNFVKLTNGPFGIAAIPRPLAGWSETAVGRNVLYLGLVSLVVAVTYVAVERLVRSPWGRVLRGLREDEAAAAALGKSPARYRLEAFVLGAMIMGLGGAIYAHFIGFVAPEDFLPILTFQVWTMLVVGGSGSNRGALLGGILVWGLWSASGALVAAAPAAGDAGARRGPPGGPDRGGAGRGATVPPPGPPRGRGRRLAPRPLLIQSAAAFGRRSRLPGAGRRGARAGAVQAIGSTQRSPEKRAKSVSQEFSSAPCSIASAARWASVTRLPAVPRGPRSWRKRTACRAPGCTTGGTRLHQPRLDDVERPLGRQRIGEDPRVRGEAEKRQQDGPRKGHRLIPRQ